MHSARSRSRSLLSALVLAALSACSDAEAPAVSVGPEIARETAGLKSLGYTGGAVSAEPSRTERAPARDEGRSLIRRASLSLQVDAGEEAAGKVQALARELGGFVAEEQTSLRARSERRSFTLRVPAARLDEALEKLAALARRVLERRVGVEDVSAQVFDLAARLKTLRATEAELLELLAQARESGRGLDDVVAVHRELTSIRAQVEQLEAQERRLGELVALATIQVELVLDPEAATLVAPGWQPLRFAERCFRQLVRGLQILVEIAMVLLFVVLPIAALVGAPLWLFWRFQRGRRVALPERDAQGVEGT
jgi:hypothetical protein